MSTLVAYDSHVNEAMVAGHGRGNSSGLPASPPLDEVFGEVWSGADLQGPDVAVEPPVWLPEAGSTFHASKFTVWQAGPSW